MKKLFFILLFAILLVSGSSVFCGCSNKQQNLAKKDKKINVMVSILPQVDFVERIGGDKVDISEMIPPGFSPATYNPSPQQLKKLQDADIYFRIGHIPFEKVQMKKLSSINPKMKVVDTSKDIKLLQLAAHSHAEDDHHEEEEHHDDEETDSIKDDHDEEGDDPHIWLSPKLVKIQALHILEALIAFNPENKKYFEKNYKEFIADLDKLDIKLKEAFQPIADQSILVFHPAFGYLADAYNFSQLPIEIEGRDPSPIQLKNIIEHAKENNIKVIFVQEQFSTKSAKAVAAEINGTVVQINPLAKDYFNNLEAMAQKIVTSIKK